jgi:2-succinyl-5-enolpyruvyl-6-hydroxy-3-cyclohexene-1-carboxylate synthase
VKAIGALHPDAAIDRLLETYQKAKQLDLAAEAVLALGNYKSSKRREYILVEVVKTGKNMVPSKSTSKNPSPETQARWSQVSPAIGKCLDNLTGEKVGDPQEWFKRVDEAKKNLKSLFRD